MKLLILIIIAFAAAIALGGYALQDPGYVVFALSWNDEPVTVRLPMALFLLITVIGFFALYLIFNFLATLFRAPKNYGKWRKGKHELSSQQYTMKGFASLVEGNWSEAEGNLLTKLDHNNASLMNYLGAAYAAQQQGQLARRNQHIEQALDEHPKQALAIKLTRARMQIQAGEMGDARDQLEFLRLSSPKNVAVTRLLADVYQNLQDWPALVGLLPSLKKLKALPEAEIQQRERLALQNHIEAPALLQGDGSKIDATFKALPSKSKKEPAAIASYVRQLIRSGEGQRAETVLRKALNKGWDGELIELYGLAQTEHAKDQIKLLEIWGQDHTEDTVLMLAMARLLRRDGQLEEAKTLLASVISETKSTEAIAELGDLLEEMEEGDAALLLYKQGLLSVSALNSVDRKIDEKPAELVALAGNEGLAEEIINTLPVVSEGKSAD